MAARPLAILTEWSTDMNPSPPKDLGSQGELSLLGKKRKNGREKNLERRGR